jgi:hypothetical protein
VLLLHAAYRTAALATTWSDNRRGLLGEWLDRIAETTSS